MKKQQHQPSLKNKRSKYSNQTNNYEKIVNKKLNLKKKSTQTQFDIPEVGLRQCGRLDNFIYQ